MKKLLFISGLLLSCCAGCANHHYTTEDRESVSLYLRLPDVNRVQLASSVDHYQLHDTTKNTLGFWEISMPLTPESSYFYVVDNSIYLPDCRFKETDDFGSENCLYRP
ncbi:MAG: hypothetical protein KKD01_04950 [Proteobacteria bacterium]|nr:hypothetical protein [Pseudomonadota bacterium]MBU1137744.1 hypothetical protein [Pseudomonadota bacterium]MBU1416902.1 hypothetical protein [Pseudomonadota bacterium]MBU1454057.1 hypothetical protein [Pseudomonadota bacterium]